MNSGSGASTALDNLVSVRDAAALLRVSESTVWRWINEGDLPSYRVGRKRVYLNRADLAPRRGVRGQGQEQRTTASATDMSARLARAAELLKRVRAMHERQRSTPGWDTARQAWQDINEMRDERARQLDPPA